MYSIVMLTALSAGADVTPPAAAPVGVMAAPMIGSSCYGSSCYGSSCYGSSYHGSSCYGSSCHGGGFRRAGGFLGHRNSCHGCGGGGGYSCTGYNCFGSSHAACHGGGLGSCYGCGAGSVSYGSSWGPPVGMPPYTLHGYNSGSLTDPHAVYGNVYHPNLPPVMTVPVAPMAKPVGSDGAPMGANLKFTVPAGAKLYVDGRLAPGTGTERSFYTPPLAAGQKFFYEVKAELAIAGTTIVEEKKVVVEAGANLTETFPTLVAAVAKAGTVAGR